MIGLAAPALAANESPEEFAAYLKTDSARWIKVIRDTGMTLD